MEKQKKNQQSAENKQKSENQNKQVQHNKECIKMNKTKHKNEL